MWRKRRRNPAAVLEAREGVRRYSENFWESGWSSGDALEGKSGQSGRESGAASALLRRFQGGRRGESREGLAATPPQRALARKAATMAELGRRNREACPHPNSFAKSLFSIRCYISI